MTPLEIGLIAACGALFIAVIILAVFLVRKTRFGEPGKKTPRIKVVDGIRYSTDTVIESGNEMKITHNEGDFSVQKGEKYMANKGGSLLPGQYTVLSAGGTEDKFNIRLGGYLREYSHGDSIVIPEGGTIECTSHNIVLR